MFKNSIFLGFVLLFQVSISQVTFVVSELPDNTPENASIYISGDFEGWSGGQESYKLTKEGNTFFITIPEQEYTISFKFTQGSWDTVERDEEGNQIDNRNYKFDKKNDTVAVKIISWDKSDGIQKSTRADNVFVLSEDFEIPQLNRKRRVWIYLPPNYKTANKSFPVIYMHDGQNLFDASTSYSGEWSVDETLNKLYKDYNASFIVVGIDNGKDKRLDEYSPWENENYGGGEGDAYLEFIVNNLKPYIDSNYKTLANKDNTAIFGSSMGGLISYYAGLKYPDVFGKIGVYSPAFWFAPEVTEFSKTYGNIQDTKMCFLAGGKEGGNTAFKEINQTVKDMKGMISTLKEVGFSSENIKSKVVPEGKHNEELWRNNFEESIRWLFPEAIKKREFLNAKLTEGNQVIVKVSDGKYLIQFYDSEIVETTFIPTGEKENTNSHAVVLNPIFVSSKFVDEDNIVTFKTSGITIKIQKQPFQISYWYNGKKITSERNGYQKNDEFETIQFNLDKNEVLYGGGARALDMNRRGNRLQLYNKAHYGYETYSELMNYTMPLVLSSKMYAIHFDNAPIGYLDLDSKKDNTLTYETISGRKTYQVIVGDSWLDLIDNYTDLTGKQPLIPRWALGNFASRFGYHSQKEVTKTVNKFSEEKIPLDAVIIDIYWFGKDIQGHMGNLEFLKDSFPNPKRMIKDFKTKGVKTVLVTEPFILTTSKRWKEAVSKDILAKDSLGNPFTFAFYFGNTGLIDIYNPKGKQWFWDIYKDLANLGVKGVWGDLGEPEVHPSNLLHTTGTADEVHNIYGHDWARMVYEGYKKDFPDQRPFILMRAGYSGSQRFGMIPWSGDVNRTWGGLQSQPKIALQMAMQGLGYMHSDLGGFAGANLDDELYTRWLQYGVFQPIYRPHAQEEVPAEPVFRELKIKALAKESIELRYKLLPYNYTLAFQNSQTGAPLMRPLFFDEPNNRNLLTKVTSYLWGNDFLIVPIMETDKKEQDVYFPKKSNWFDFYTDEKFEGGETKTIATHPNYIPTFVRAGAFIPMAKPIQTTDDYDANNLEVHYYYDTSVNQSKTQLYNDDGVTANAFEKGKYELLEFKSDIKKYWLEIELEAKTGVNYQSKTKQIELILHNINSKPKRIRLNGKKIEVNWSSSKNTLTIPLQWNTSKELKLKLKK
jgi:alpha-glucosidase (family GH31 glycosyl hydrolase)